MNRIGIIIENRTGQKRSSRCGQNPQASSIYDLLNLPKLMAERRRCDAVLVVIPARLSGAREESRSYRPGWAKQTGILRAAALVAPASSRWT